MPAWNSACLPSCIHGLMQAFTCACMDSSVHEKRRTLICACIKFYMHASMHMHMDYAYTELQGTWTVAHRAAGAELPARDINMSMDMDMSMDMNMGMDMNTGRPARSCNHRACPSLSPFAAMMPRPPPGWGLHRHLWPRPYPRGPGPLCRQVRATVWMCLFQSQLRCAQSPRT